MEYFKKLKAIRDFLKDAFEASEVSDTYDDKRFAQTFTVSDENKKYLVTLTRNFIDNHKADELPYDLKKTNIRDYFNDKNIKRVTIDTSGVITE